MRHTTLSLSDAGLLWCVFGDDSAKRECMDVYEEIPAELNRALKSAMSAAT